MQVLCTLFFVWDIVAGVLGLRRAPMAWEMRELMEMGAALGLVLGVVLGAVLLVAHPAAQPRGREPAPPGLRRPSPALLEERFAEWELTPSERDVAWFTIKGLSIAEIARLRGTSEGTVKAHSNAIYRKAGVSGRTQLLSLFIEDLMERAAPPDGSRAARSARRTRVARPARSAYAARPGRRFARRRRGGPGARARYGMEKLEIGDLVVLTSGSMRMAVEGVDGGKVACVWCHEGKIGRDAFDARLLKKWEFREDDRPARADGGRQALSAATARAAASPTARRAREDASRAASPAGTASPARRSSSARTAEAG